MRKSVQNKKSVNNAKGKNNINKNLKNIKNNLNNNGISLEIEDVPLSVDVIACVFAVGLIILYTRDDVEIPDTTKNCFIFALILLMYLYSVELAIIVVIIAIVYVLCQQRKNNKKNNNVNGN